MELHQLRCFVAVADELHFGRAAQRLDMLPAALGRHIRLLEEALGSRLLIRTTRSVALSDDGAALLPEARLLIGKADALKEMFRFRQRAEAVTLRIGTIDTAAAGLMPALLSDFRERFSEVAVQLNEDKTIRLVPRLLSGRLDLVFIRPPERMDGRIACELLFHETAVVAVPRRHPLANRKRLSIDKLQGEPLIVPHRRSRPHSHDLTIKLFDQAGIRPSITQVAEEKQTIVNLVAAGLGLAIMPRWASRMAVAGVKYVPLTTKDPAVLGILPLAAAWLRDTRDPARERLLETLRTGLLRYSVDA